MNKKFRHNELKLDHLRSDVFYDKDLLILHFSFELLVKFVEEELKKDCITNWSEGARGDAYDEIMSLYRWWISHRYSGNILGDVHHYETKQLCRLMKVREFLWT